ncbi:3783_t:CDS:1, partial [Paraglomus occultum]
MPSDSEIIEAVLNGNNIEEEEEEYNESISHNKVISNINNILRFTTKSNNDVK